MGREVSVGPRPGKGKGFQGLLRLENEKVTIRNTRIILRLEITYDTGFNIFWVYLCL